MDIASRARARVRFSSLFSRQWHGQDRALPRDCSSFVLHWQACTPSPSANVLSPSSHHKGPFSPRDTSFDTPPTLSEHSTTCYVARCACAQPFEGPRRTVLPASKSIKYITGLFFPRACVFSPLFSYFSLLLGFSLIHSIFECPITCNAGFKV
ncbi:hypothetical protein F5148DRAFT_817875 [Russula earlei]|uniref:Uncharacterized protein n=1 Tax=Russula earlei TaxID=71964 RepID=A0ACC0TSF8_9AGAM|nr:hypothetical protein F5148DRAFT_817875 [Russula earlei]